MACVCRDSIIRSRNDTKGNGYTSGHQKGVITTLKDYLKFVKLMSHVTERKKEGLEF